MATLLRQRIGLADHGQLIPYEVFAAAEWEEGYRYELIEGRLYVSPVPNLPENRVQEWLDFKLKLYTLVRPDIINYISAAARIFIPRRRGVTNPQPDLAAYRNYPLDLCIDDIHWPDVQPILAVEIPSRNDPDKDFVRNLRLYLLVASIREYWILDTRQSAEQPTLIVYRRRGNRWQRPIEIAYGETYTTKLLPGFALVIDPRS